MEPITSLVAGVLLPELVAVGKGGAKHFMQNRAEQAALRKALDAADSWLLGQLGKSEIDLLRRVDATLAQQIAFAIADLGNDLEGHELKSTIVAVIEAADPLDELSVDRKKVSDALYGAIVRALAASELAVGAQGRLLLFYQEQRKTETALQRTLAAGFAATGTADQLSLQLLLLSPDLEPPAAAPRRVLRSAVVDELTQARSQAGWLAVYGPSGSGKTQLALLLTGRSAQKLLWLNLRGASAEQAAERARQARLLGLTRSESAVALVLDDLPRLVGGGALASELARISATALGRGVSIISLSNHPLPPDEITRLGVKEVACPQFTAEDARDLLVAHGCPSGAANKLTTFCHAVSRGNGVLLGALARYLAAQDWSVDLDALGRVLGGEYKEDLAGALLTRILETVSSATARQLLYRLRLVSGPFGVAEVQAVAAIDPSVPSPREALHALQGEWVEQLAGSSWRLAAVLSVLPADCLAVHEQQRTHAALAATILARKQLPPDEVFALVLHLTGAGDVTRAASALLTALAGLYDRPDVTWHAGLLEVWGTLRIPAEVPKSLRMVLVAQQLLLRKRFGLSTRAKTTELDELGEDTDALESGTLIAIVNMFARELLRDHTSLMARLIERAIRVRHSARLPGGDSFILPKGLKIAAFPLYVALYVENIEQARVVASVLSNLEHDEFRQLGVDDLVEQAAFALAELPLRAATPESDWVALVELLAELQLVGERLRWDALRYRSMRRRALVVAEHLSDVDMARAILNGASVDGPLGTFMLEESRARISLIGKDRGAAVLYFEKALQSSFVATSTSWDLFWVGAAIDASFASDALDKSIQWLQEALSRSRNVEDHGVIQRIRILGELALVLHLAGRWREAFVPLREAMEGVRKKGVVDTDGRGCAVLLWNVASFIATDVCHGDAERWGMQRPTRGIMYADLTKAADEYVPRRQAIAEVLFAQYCYAVGSEVRERWVEYSDVTDEIGQLEDARPGYELLMVPLIVRRDTPADVLKRVPSETGAAGLIFVMLELSLETALRGRTAQSLQTADTIRALVAGYDAPLRREFEEASHLFQKFGSGFRFNGSPQDLEPRNAYLAMLFASVDDSLSYAQMFSLQVAVFMRVQFVLREARGADFLVAAPALSDFWSRKIARSRFQFSAPSEALRELQRLDEIHPTLRLEHVLRVMATSLAIQLPSMPGLQGRAAS